MGCRRLQDDEWVIHRKSGLYVPRPKQLVRPRFTPVVWPRIYEEPRMAIALAQNTVKAFTAASGTTVGATFGSTTTAGNAIIVATYWPTNGSSVSIGDGTNTYTSALVNVQQTTDGHEMFLFVAYNIAGGAAVTVTATKTGANVTDRWICIWEVSGLATASAFDKSSTNTSGASANTAGDSGSTATTTQADEFLVGAFGGSGVGFTNIVPGTNWTERQEIANGSAGLAGYTEDRIVAAAAAYNATCTFDSNQTWSALIGTFKAVSAAPTSNISIGTCFQKTHRPGPFRPGLAR